MSEVPPKVPYWHVWADDDGVSRQTRREMTKFDLKSIAAPAKPQWQGEKIRGETTTMVTVLPVGWIGDWHENPKPQWIIPLSGRWFVETMDGRRVQMGPGEISLGEDQGTHARAGRQGHRSGVVGSEPAVLFLVQRETASEPEKG